MIKKIGLLFLALIIGISIIGCAKVADQTTSTNGIDVTNVTGAPPAGTTQCKLSAGNVVVSGNSIGFSVTALNQSNNVLSGMGGGNFTGAIYSSNPSISSVTATTTLTAVASLTVTSVTFAGSGVSAALVIDKSGSMWYDKLVSAEVAGKLFVDQLANASSSNKAAAVLFDTYISTEAGMMYASANKQTLYNAITKEAGYGGSTALFDAIAQGISEASKEAPSASRVRAVVALTDGGENSSTICTTTTEVINRAVKASIPVYTVALFSSTSEGTYSTVNGGTQRGDLQNIALGTTGSLDNYFEIIIGETGLSVSAERVRALGVLTDLYQKISSALTQSYSFTCTTSTTLTPGTYWLMLTLQNYGSFTGQTVIISFVVI